MADAEAPEQPAGNEKQSGEDGKQHGERSAAVPEQVHQRVILHKGIGNNKCAELQHALAINGKRVAPVLLHAVCKDVYELKPLQGEKAQGGVNEENTRKDGGAADRHEDQRTDTRGIPCDCTVPDGIDQQAYGDGRAPDARKLDPAAEHLQNFIARTDHDAVEFTVANDAPKRVEAPGEALGKRK